MSSQVQTMVRREFWEQRALWLAPLMAAGFLILATAIGAAWVPDQVDVRGNGNFRIGGQGMSPMMGGAMGVAALIMLISSITCFNYLLDCLYAERKDRSILFWKSLPVSDASTVLVKFAVAMLIVPVGAYLLGVVTHLIVSGVFGMFAPQLMGLNGGWHFSEWLTAEGRLLNMMVTTQLWYAPIATWLMICSVSSRRTPVLMAVLPFVVLGLGESILFHTSYVWRFVGYRLVPRSDLVHLIAEPAMWVGLAVAAGMLYIVIRLRRYRDDT